MNQHFDLQKIARNNVLALINGCSAESLNAIPPKFSNNLIWNVGHILVTQQLLLYKLSGVSCRVDNEMIEKYRKGTKPEGVVSQEEIDFIIQQLVITADLARVDYQNKHFGDYAAYPTSFGVTLHSIEDAITFNNMHESMHLGTMIALKKFV